MLKLIYKDLLISRKTLILSYTGNMLLYLFIIAPYIVVRYIPSADVDMKSLDTMMALMTMWCGIYFAGILFWCFDEIMKKDENRKWAGFIISSPVSAEGAVKEKYLFWLLSGSVVLIGVLLLENLFCIITGSENSAMFSSAYAVMLIQTLIKAIELPFIYRFGSVRGNNIRMGIIGIIISAAVVYGLFGDLSGFGDFEQVLEGIARFVTEGTDSKPLLFAFSAMPYVTGILMYISYKLSVKFYTKGLEEYEE